jgi:hypothetical protein
MEHFLTASELYEAEAEYDRWLRETGNDPQSVFEEIVVNSEES